MKKQNTVSFADIFHFAKEKFGIEWNPANELFFRSDILRYKGYDSFDLEEVEGDVERLEEEKSEYKIAYEILEAFMKENKVKKMLVLNN